MNKIHHYLGLAIILFFTACYILLVLNRFWQFEYFFTDNVYFDTALWKVSQFQPPIVIHEALGKVNILGDHFHPTIFLLSPIYRFFPSQATILVLAVLAYSASAFIGMLIGFKLIKNKIITLALLIPYYLYIGTQNAFIYGFHEINLMPLFFMITIFGLVTSRNKLYWAGLTLLLLTKESFATVAVCIGMFVFLAYPQKRKLALMTIILSLTYFFLITRLIIPSFSGRYLYGESSSPGNLAEIITRLTSPREKLHTVLVSVSTFGFLPLLNPFTLPLLIQDFLLRFVFTIPGSIQYTLSYHYNLILAPIMFFSSVWTINLFSKHKTLSKIVIVLMLASLLSTIYYFRFSSFRGPVLLTLNKDFYSLTEKNQFLWTLVKKVPSDGKISTQNHLGYPLSHNEVYLLPSNCDQLRRINPEYFVLDLRPEQNPNNFFPLTKDRILKLKNELLASGSYKVYFSKGLMYILKKTTDAQPSCTEA